MDGDDLVGMGNIDLRGQVPVIWKLYVLAEHQGRGVGSALMAGLLDRASSGRVRLEYVDGNAPAAGCYVGKGFREAGREPGERPGWPDLIWVERPDASHR